MLTKTGQGADQKIISPPHLILDTQRLSLYPINMIKGYKNKASQKVSEGQQVNRFRGLSFELARKRLSLLSGINDLSDIPPLRSLNLHKLQGDRKGQWAINVNGPWRIVFDWIDGQAANVEIVDYHRG